MAYQGGLGTVSSNDVPSYVPAKYISYVSAAANALGIPAAVVAAQIELESSFNPNARSSAGAEGIAQFEPGTFRSYGSGSPYNVDDAFNAYTAYMKALLKQEGGDLSKALEAYNAGPGNLGAGSGYASTILSKAGSGDLQASGGSSAPSSGGGILSWPSEITDWFSQRAKDSADAFKVFDAFFKPSTYVRAGSGLIGSVFLLMGIVGLVMASREKG